MLLAFLIAATPVPGELKTFSDWTVGCDNGRACQAVALLPEDGADGAILAIQRGGQANAAPRIWVTVRMEGLPSLAALVVDGRRFPLRLDPVSQELLVADAAQAARMLGQATRIEALVEEGGRRTVPISTKGSAAALLYMDEQQRRVGTASALVRHGTATAVPPAPALPTINVPPASSKAPRRLAGARVRQLLGRDATVCEFAQGLDVEAVRLDADTSLNLASHPCGSGAYNLMSTAFLVDERGRARRAAYDLGGGMGEGGDDTLVNAGWDADTRRLTSFAKGRGLGDCGVGHNYAWDGTRFRLVEQVAMGECRGSTDYITTWRARVAPGR